MHDRWRLRALAVERASSELLGHTASDGGDDSAESKPELTVGESATYGVADLERLDIRYSPGQRLPCMVYLTVNVTATNWPAEPGYVQGHFVSDTGRVYDYTGYTCLRDDLPTGDGIQPGQYVQGCEAYDIPTPPAASSSANPATGSTSPSSRSARRQNRRPPVGDDQASRWGGRAPDTGRCCSSGRFFRG